MTELRGWIKENATLVLENKNVLYGRKASEAEGYKKKVLRKT
jgi:hypothetical protein